MRIGYILKAGRIAVVSMAVVLVGAIILLYRTEGRGLAFYLCLVFPLLSIGTGMIAIIRKRNWIVVSAIYHFFLFLYLYLNDSEQTGGYVLFFSCYILLSIISGFCFQGMSENKTNKR